MANMDCRLTKIVRRQALGFKKIEIFLENEFVQLKLGYHCPAGKRSAAEKDLL